MTEVCSSSLRPSPLPDIKTRATYDTAMSTPRRSVVPSDYSDLSPLDALAAQGRLLNKRLTQQSGRSTDSPPPGAGVLDDSVFPKFGVSDTFENREFRGYEKRNRVPEKRKGGGSESPQSPVDTLSMATLSLLSVPQNPSATTATPSPPWPPSMAPTARTRKQAWSRTAAAISSKPTTKAATSTSSPPVAPGPPSPPA